MATTTVIERLPADWLNSDQFGEGWDEAGIDPVGCWRAMFVEWLAAEHPGFVLCGDEVIGPADADVPESLYEAFDSLHEGDWAGAIEDYARSAQH